MPNPRSAKEEREERKGEEEGGRTHMPTEMMVEQQPVRYDTQTDV